MNRPVFALLTVLSLAGCAGGGHRSYPSLALRPVERGSFDEPVRPVATVTPDAALDATIARQRAELERLVAGFAAEAVETEHRVAAAAGATVGSDTWLAAQAALARLDGWRSQTSALTAALDDAGAARAAALLPPYPALAALTAQAAAETDRESSVVDRLQRRIPAA